MTHPNHEKHITRFFVSAQIAFPVLSILSWIIYPPDFSKEFPLYDPNCVMLWVLAASIWIGGLAVMAIKLADERKVLPAAGFTVLAISGGVLLSSTFEITQVISVETYTKFYRIQTSGYFLYLPGMYLITFYDEFKRWIRYMGLLSSLVLITCSFLFLAGNRNFNTLETIANIGLILLFLTTFSWAYNVYSNYKKNQKAQKI